MKNLIPIVSLIALALVGCPKRADTTVAGTDEEQLDRYSARLEELRVRSQAETLSCSDTCKMKDETCDLARRICDISSRQQSAQERCVTGNEDCARFNDSCAACGG